MIKQSGIYKIQSKIKPERVYIGSSVNMFKRCGVHLQRLKARTHDNIKLQNHFNKYGEVDLQFSVLLGCEKEDLVKTEQYFIDSYCPWFNICKIANSKKGVSPSPETRAKQRLAKLGKKQSRETIEKRKKSIGDPWNKGKKATEAAKLNQSKSHIGQQAWNKGKKGFMKGRVTSEETKRKIGEANSKKTPSIEVRNRISETLKKNHLLKVQMN